jgi:hypothetical protein
MPLSADFNKGALHLVGKTDDADTGFRLRFRLRHLGESGAQVRITVASDRFKHTRASVPEAVKGAGEGHGGVGDRRHVLDYAHGRLSFCSEVW